MPRPSLKPTPETRRLVKTMAACGLKQEDICKALNIRSAKTLRTHYRRELDLGHIEAMTNVVRTLYQMATSGKCPSATRFWLERSGWGARRDAETRPTVLPDFIVAPAREVPSQP